jgi:hypothetical protein
VIDDIEKLLQDAQESFKALPIARTPECPADIELLLLCFEEDDGPLKNKHMRHIIICPYCSRYVLKIIKDKIESRNSLQEMKRRYYPLPEEINWLTIRAIGLYKDNEKVLEKDYSHAIADIDFSISQAGYYHIATDTRQIIWRREIRSNEIILSNQEQDKLEHFGLASTTEGFKEGIQGFTESFWDDGLQVTLLKGISEGKLIFRFNY